MVPGFPALALLHLFLIASTWAYSPHLGSQATYLSFAGSSELLTKSCSCMDWHEVYSKNKSLCGQGFEFYNWMNRGPLKPDYYKFEEFRSDPTSVYRMICESFFLKLTGNRAIRMKFQTPPEENGKPWDASWCYVSPECEDLQGGAEVPSSGHKHMGTTLGVKVVQNSAPDVQLSQMDPNALIRLSSEYGLNLSLLLGYAYYSVRGFGNYVNLGLVRQAEQSGLTTVVHPGDPLNPRMIVRNRDRWLVQTRSDKAGHVPSTWWKAAPYNARALAPLGDTTHDVPKQ